MRRRKIAIAIFVFLLFSILHSLFSVIPAFAQTPPSNAFVVRPARVEATLAPGEVKTFDIRLSNGTPAPLSIITSFEDVAPNAQTSAVDEPVKLLGAEKGVHSMQGLFAISRSSFDVLSNREVVVPVTVRIPKDTLPGGRYGTVIFTFTPVTSGEGDAAANVAVESRAAVMFYVRITGEAKEEGALAAFGLFNNAKTAPIPDAAHPLRLQVAYENTGDVHLNPYGRIVIGAAWGGGEHPIVIEPWAVLPGATRMREIDFSETLAPGYYRAHLELNRGYGDVVDERDAAFWVLPTAAQSFVGIIILLALIWIVRKSLRLSRNFVK